MSQLNKNTKLSSHLMQIGDDDMLREVERSIQTTKHGGELNINIIYCAMHNCCVFFRLFESFFHFLGSFIVTSESINADINANQDLAQVRQVSDYMSSLKYTVMFDIGYAFTVLEIPEIGKKY